MAVCEVIERCFEGNEPHARFAREKRKDMQSLDLAADNGRVQRHKGGAHNKHGQQQLIEPDHMPRFVEYKEYVADYHGEAYERGHERRGYSHNGQHGAHPHNKQRTDNIAAPIIVFVK